MQNLSKLDRKLALAITIWLLCVILALGYFQLSGLQEFDPKRKLQRSGWLIEFKNLTESDNLSKATLALFVDPQCGCTKRSKTHIQQLEHLASSDLDVVVHSYNSTIKDVIPNTPAAVLIDAYGALVYAGPLSEGLACSASDGFVELVISNLLAGFNSELVISDAKGCYCSS